MADVPNVGSNLPEVGRQYTFKGQPVTVTAVKKRGRGYYVAYEAESGQPWQRARLKDWRAGAG